MTTFHNFMTTLHNFAIKIETGSATRLVYSILDTRNVNVYMCVRFAFSYIKYLLGASKISYFELQLR